MPLAPLTDELPRLTDEIGCAFARMGPRSAIEGTRMKLAPANSAGVREARTDQLRRDRAGSQVMRAAFPSVQKLRLQLKFAGSHPNVPTPQLHELYPPARAFFTYPCPYPGCDGYFDLSTAVRSAIAAASHLSQGTIECGGSRPRDHASRQSCLLQLRYEVEARCDDKSSNAALSAQT